MGEAILAKPALEAALGFNQSFK